MLLSSLPGLHMPVPRGLQAHCPAHNQPVPPLPCAADVHLVMHGTLGDGVRHILSGSPHDFDR